MSKIPLSKYAAKEYPMTSYSTINYYAKQAFYHNKGPLAGMIIKVGGRWYVKLCQDEVVNNIVDDILRQID